MIRWPLHPAPLPGEALSWLRRLAGVYDMSAEELLRHNLWLAPGDLDLGEGLAGSIWTRRPRCWPRSPSGPPSRCTGWPG